MGVSKFAFVLTGALSAFLAGAAPSVAQFAFTPEVRGGVFAHSVDEAGPDGLFFNPTRIEDVNVELLVSTPLSDLVIFGQLRPHVGATVNFGGLESMVYAGLSYTFDVPATPLFIEASLGGALHDGALSGAIPPARNLGCSVLFRESASLGVNLGENASLMLTVEHASHASLCGPDNRGLTNLGVRFGYTF